MIDFHIREKIRLEDTLKQMDDARDPHPICEHVKTAEQLRAELIGQLYQRLGEEQVAIGSHFWQIGGAGVYEACDLLHAICVDMAREIAERTSSLPAYAGDRSSALKGGHLQLREDWNGILPEPYPK